MPPADTEPTTLSNPGQTTVWGRLSQTFLRPPAQKTARDEQVDFTRMTDDEKRALIVGVDPTEKKIGIAASLLGVALAIYANVPYMVSKTSVVTTVKPKGKSCPPVLGITDLHYVASTSSCNGIYPASHYVLPLIVSLVLAV